MNKDKVSKKSHKVISSVNHQFTAPFFLLQTRDHTHLFAKSIAALMYTALPSIHGFTSVAGGVMSSVLKQWSSKPCKIGCVQIQCLRWCCILFTAAVFPRVFYCVKWPVGSERWLRYLLHLDFEFNESRSLKEEILVVYRISRGNLFSQNCNVKW